MTGQITQLGLAGVPGMRYVFSAAPVVLRPGDVYLIPDPGNYVLIPDPGSYAIIPDGDQ